MEPPRIRLAASDDIAGIQYSADALQKAVDDPQSIFLVAEVKDSLSGFVHLTMRSTEVVVLGRIYVLSQHQRKGVGSRLLQAALSKIGCHTIVVNVEERNEKGRRFYERHGFKPIENTTINLFGHPLPIVAYQKTVTPPGYRPSGK